MYKLIKFPLQFGVNVAGNKFKYFDL